MYTWTLPSSLDTPVAMGAPTNRSDRPSAFRSTAHTLAPKYEPSFTQRHECRVSLQLALNGGRRRPAGPSYLSSRHFGDDLQQVVVDRKDVDLGGVGDTHKHSDAS